jgi:hypothetical protein
MNAVEIEAAVSELAGAIFDASEFPYAFLAAFGNKDTTIARLRKGDTNKSDLPGGVLQRNNIHLAVAKPGQVNATLSALRTSPETAKGKVKFVLATDGVSLEAEEIITGETLACDYPKFAGHFGFFLPLAGISTIKEIKDSAVDIRATGRLNKLYLELLRENPEWAKEERRHDMNHFMARLIFCFFAEDTGIFEGSGLFTKVVDQMSETTSANTHEVIRKIFCAMNVPTKGNARVEAKIPAWADRFPYVNGGLFAGSVEVPRFTRIARTYLLHAGHLDWHEINPDIFGSMIQAVADDEERGALGMHYTSVPNILKVLNPLFLDDLRDQLEAADDNKAKLLNLRKRMARIRVFDPACGSGNFLVIAYKQMRAIEVEINQRRGERGLKSVIPLTNFRGIELRDFPAEIARLALIIAEYQCDVLYLGQKQAVQEFLPLDAQNWIVCGNALRLDWLQICPPTGTGVKLVADDLFESPLNQSEIDFENVGGETYICGNPPYLGGKGQSTSQKAELASVFGSRDKIGELDYVAAWLLKGAEYAAYNDAEAAFVATNSVNQGAQVHQLWPRIFMLGIEISFAHKDFKWSNNATNNAAVICSILGLRKRGRKQKVLFENGLVREVTCIGPYLVPGHEIVVSQALAPISDLMPIITGNSPYDGGHLILSSNQRAELVKKHPNAGLLVKRLYGSKDYLSGEQRYCLWIDNANLPLAESIPEIKNRIEGVRLFRLSGGEVARGLASRPHQFRYTHQAKSHLIIAPRVSSERRLYIPFGLLPSDCIVGDSAQAIYDAEVWHLSILLSLMHMSWVRTVSGRLKTDLRYSSALCYNTFPVPLLTDQNKTDLTRCAEEILLAREAHFPAAAAELYDPESMPANLRHAHERNDEVVERIYIGRRFKNDTERLEKLFDLYEKTTATEAKPAKKTTTRARKNAP